MQTDTQQKSVQHLNSFLRGEISAVETYKQAIGSLKDVASKSELQQCASTHQKNVDLLREKIRSLGGDPAESSGVWGGFAKLVQAGADIIGEKTAVAALEEGEDHGLADYKRDLKDLDGETRSFVEQKLLPSQVQTHATMSRLKHSLN